MNLGGRMGNWKDVLVKSEEDAGIFVFEIRRQTLQHLDGLQCDTSYRCYNAFPFNYFYLCYVTEA